MGATKKNVHIFFENKLNMGEIFIPILKIKNVEG